MNIYEMEDLKAIIDKATEGVDNLKGFEFSKENKREILRATNSILSGATILLSRSMPFVAGFKANVRTIITYEMEAPMAVNVTNSGLSVVNNLYVNPIWMTYKMGVKSEGEFLTTFDDVAMVILHEMFHLLYNHISAYESFARNGFMQEVNIGTDAQINQEKNIAANKTLTEYGVTLKAVQEMLKDPSIQANNSSKYYVELLIKNKPKGNNCQQGNSSSQQGQGSSQQQGQGQGSGQQQQQSEGQSGSGQGESQGQQSGQGSGQDQQNQGNDQQQGQGSGQQNPQDQKGPMGANASHNVWKESPKDATEEGESVADGHTATSAIAEAVKRTLDQNPNIDPSTLKERGLVAGDILAEALSGQAKKGKLSIKTLIQKGASRLKLGEKKTYSRINHNQSNNIKIKRGKRDVNNKNIRVYVDTSGSMGEEEVTWALKEIAAVAYHVKANLSVIPFDTKVYPENAMEVKRNGTFEVKVAGRGGTSFQPVLDHLKSLNATNNNDVIIIISDGYGESQVNFYGLNNIIWLMVEMKTNTLSVENPPGRVGWLDQDDKYILHKLNS